MSGRNKRVPKSRSSIIFCEEKYNCEKEKCEARFECKDCASKQCGSCECALHSSKLHWHDRQGIELPNSLDLCQASCDKRNFADVCCDDCNLNLCNVCNDKIHSKSRKKSHNRRQFQPLQLQVQLLEPEHSEEQTEQPLNNLSSDFAECISEYFTTPENSLGSNANGVTDGDLDAIPQLHITEIGNNVKRELKPKDMIAKESSVTRVRSEPEVSMTRPSAQQKSTGQGQMKNEVPTQDKQRSKKMGHTNDIDDEIYSKCCAFLLADQDEKIKVDDEKHFVKLLNCDEQSQVKVISIFGNTGDGKSHTLNHTFFGGREIFQTSSCQKSCTLGVWAAFDPVHNVIVIDTEGLLGVSPNQNQRTRLLLKVLAVSDIVIYRTKADRLHNDLFIFLGDASTAYSKHFTEELKAASKRCNLDACRLGPAVIIFHETQHTDVLGTDRRQCPDNFIKAHFAELEQDIDAYSSIHYVGTRTNNQVTDFNGLLLAVKKRLRDTSVRSPRRPQFIFRALKVLNEKFNGDIQKVHPSSFPDQYFTCTAECLSCRNRCTETVNHDDMHKYTGKCKYQDQYDNRVYLCKMCYDRGDEQVVVPKTSGSRESNWLALAKYAWSGYVLECRRCGIIYRSRQYWYGNEDPVKTVVRTEVRHLWPGDNRLLQGTHNAARRLLDGINFVTDSIASVGAKPTKAVSMWLTDRIAPPYWVPNANITTCQHCNKLFDNSEQIHHCRACGFGFCDLCSEKKRPVPERGWGLEPVRVCDNCYDQTSSMSDSGSSDHDSSALMPRKIGEAIGSTVGAVASVVNYPLDAIQNSARPVYWIPNHKIKKCWSCSELFGPKLSIHHCRACGQGVCNSCSTTRCPVPFRGWDHDVRVCDKCNGKLQQM